MRIDSITLWLSKFKPICTFFVPCSAERGLSNYLLFERARQDPKIAKHMAKTDKFVDDDQGRLVRLEDAQRAGAATSGVVIGSGKLPGTEAAARGAVVSKKGRRKAEASAADSASSEASSDAAEGAR